MTVTDSAYVAVLERKLYESEQRLYEFRRIFEHWIQSNGKGDKHTSVERVQQGEPMGKVHRTIERNSDGLFPGQLPNQVTDDEDDFDPAEAGKSEEECIE
jgi:hypothetical protein